MELHDETEKHAARRQGLFRPVWAEEILQLVHECGSSQAGSSNFPPYSSLQLWSQNALDVPKTYLP